MFTPYLIFKKYELCYLKTNYNIFFIQMQFAEREFMENIEKIIENQQKLLVLIQKYEDKSRLLLGCDIDEIADLVNARESIINRIDVLTKEILSICNETSPEYLAFKNKCDRESLPENIKEIFDLRQEFNSYAMRAYNMDPEIVEKIKINRDLLLKKIKENNSGQTAKAAKYFNAGLSQGQNIYFPENKRKI